MSSYKDNADNRVLVLSKAMYVPPKPTNSAWLYWAFQCGSGLSPPAVA